MKNLKFVFLALGCMAALSLTSCMKNENTEEGLSSSDFSKCLNAVRGDYNGYLLYGAVNPQIPADDIVTLAVSWSITADTMLIVRDFPLAPVVEKIVDANLKKELQEQNLHHPLRCHVGFTMIDPYIEFLLAPLALEVPVTYKGQTHTLLVYFWFDSHSFGAKNLLTQEMNIQLVVAAAYLDDADSLNLLSRDYSTTVQVPILLTTVDLNAEEEQ